MNGNLPFDKKKIIVIIGVIVLVVLIIVGSRSITKSSSKKEKNLEIKEANQVKKVEETQENVVLETNSVVENKVEENKVENVTNVPMSSVKNEVKKSEKNASTKGKLPVSNPESVALCKKAQSSDEKNIYLTFDDGPSPNITPQILKILKEYDVPATFFVLGSRVELYPEILKQEYEAGHYIANHGYSHKYSSIYSSVQSVIDEYNSNEKAIQTALGIPEYHSYLFRFPGGSSGGPYNDLKQEAKKKLESMNIASTNWNCLNGDAEATGRTKEQLVNRLYDTAKGWNSLVVLMHDADDKQTTADALPEIIEHYKNEGYTFKNYYEIFQ